MCGDAYSKSRKGEKLNQCLTCKDLAHNSCVDDSGPAFYCNNSDDDMQ